MNVGDINSQLLLDIIAVLNYYFEEVELFKGSLQPTTKYSKNLIAKNFRGITENEYQDLLQVSKKWHEIQEDCFTKTKKFSKDKYYIKSILNYQGNLNEIQNFQIKEDEKKIIIFNNIINTYNSLKSGGENKLRELIDKKIYQRLVFLKLWVFSKNLISKNYSGNNQKRNNLKL